MQDSNFPIEFRYYPFAVRFDRCDGSCTLIDSCNKVCIPNKTEDLNLSVFNIIIRINESKTLRNLIPCECKCKFDGEKCILKSNQWWNNDKCTWECKNIHVYEKDYVWTPALCICENGKYSASIMDD